MILEEQRFLHEDLERLEQGISDRLLDEPRHIRGRLNRDHHIANFLDRIESQSQRLLELYQDVEGTRAQEIRTISTGDPFEEFYKQLGDIKTFHQKYPNERVENLEKAYQKRPMVPGEPVVYDTDNMFTGEEGFGRFFDLTTLHETYLNLPGVKRPTYLQYLDMFDIFVPPHCPIKRPEKMTDRYFTYINELATYLEGFLRRTRPLDPVDKLLAEWDDEFDKAWAADQVPGWQTDEPTIGPSAGPAQSTWCADCEKEFTNDNVYKSHLTGKKHIRAAQQRAARLAAGEPDTAADAPSGSAGRAPRLKERAIAERETRIRRLAAEMAMERGETRVNVERKQGMTEREREIELEAIFADEDPAGVLGGGPNADGDAEAEAEESEDEGDKDKIYNPLKLPLGWDGKPIPFWLYKLHGLGVEYSCEICGNFVYMGRRDFDKHFGEARHVYGLRCLGITNTGLFREITGIEDALKLWEKLQRDKRNASKDDGYIIQMEDADGNVMPEKVYYDLQKQGLL